MDGGLRRGHSRLGLRPRPACRRAQAVSSRAAPVSRVPASPRATPPARRTPRARRRKSAPPAVLVSGSTTPRDPGDRRHARGDGLGSSRREGSLGRARREPREAPTRSQPSPHSPSRPGCLPEPVYEPYQHPLCARTPLSLAHTCPSLQEGGSWSAAGERTLVTQPSAESFISRERKGRRPI